MVTGTRVRSSVACGPIGLAFIAFCVTWAAPDASLADVPPPPSSLVRKPPPEFREDMTEGLRAQVDSIAVVATRNRADEAVAGSYEKDTFGWIGGAAGGWDLGQIRKEVGPVPVLYRIPGTAVPGAILGALFGGVQKEVQQLRDAMTEELIDAKSTPLSDDGLAMDVYSRLRRVLESNARIVAPTTPFPENTDAVLHVKFAGVSIDVQGADAVITTTAAASLNRLGDNVSIYRTLVHYRDRDSLRNWTEDDNRLWHGYVNYARHYLGREIAARVYNRVEQPQTLTPETTESMRRDRENPMHFVSKSTRPELAWTLEIGEGTVSPFVDEGAKLDESVTWYDVEIYDRDRLVLVDEGVAEPRYTVPMDLACGDYRWSVRPSWRVDGIVRYGRWMRFPPPPQDDEEAADDGEGKGEEPPPNGLSGRAASEAPAYTQDFPSLRIDCG